jgi:hypothetical protein
MVRDCHAYLHRLIATLLGTLIAWKILDHYPKFPLQSLLHYSSSIIFFKADNGLETVMNFQD